ncbi:hypothetical protein KSS87_017123 [Heliosperma pusillum]|nr:hypothetical protein KSS87_017123 [Heliosperma pusillum]
MMQLILFIIALLFCTFIIFTKNKKNKSLILRRPPGPKGLPVIGNLHQYDFSRPHVYLAKLAKTYGSILSLQLGGAPMVVVQSAKLAKEVLKTQDLNFCNRPPTIGVRKLSYNGLDIAFSPYNEYFREVKKICVVHLFNSIRVRSFAPILQDEITRLMNKITSLSSSSSTIDLSILVPDFACTNICRIAFGRSYEDDEGCRNEFRKLLHEAEVMFIDLMYSDYFPLFGWLDKLTGKSDRLEKIFLDLDAFYQKIIDDHLDSNKCHNNNHREDLVDVLLQLRKEQLIKNPNAMKKVQDELRKNVPPKTSCINEHDHLQALQYFKAVVKETFRLHPVSPLLVAHQAIRQTKIDGYNIEPGTIVQVNAWAIGRDPVSWTDPDKFMPERFLGSSIDFKGQDFELIPFGAGRRMCPALHLGIVNFELTLANLLHFFDWKLPVGVNKEDVDTDTIPGPKGLPVIGNLHQYDFTRPHVYLAELAKTYGSIVSLRLGYAPMVVVQSAKLAKEVLKTQDLNFCTRPPTVGIRKLSYNGLDIAFSPYNEYFREVKKICVVHLLNSIRVRSFAPIQQDEITKLMNKITSLSSSSSIVNLSILLPDFACSNICRIAFGRSYADDEGCRIEFRRLLDEAEVMFIDLAYADYFPSFGWLDRLTGKSARLEKVFLDLDAFYQKIIDEHLDPNNTYNDNNHHEDLIDVLLHLGKKRTDTSSTMVIWAMTELIKNSDTMKKVQDELRKNVPSKTSYIVEDDLQNLEYFKAVVKETFRLHPPAPLLVAHQAIRQSKIHGYDIEPGTIVQVNAWAIGRDPVSWTDPDKFMPERFLGSSIDFKGQDFELIPFGAGRRMCPGVHLGTVNFELTLANLLHFFDWKLPIGVNKEDVDTDTFPGITMLKRNPLRLMPKKFH